MKTTMDLPNDLIREVKLRALQEGRKLKDAMADLLRKGLAASHKQPPRKRRAKIKTHPKTGLPYVRCAPDAPARRMTSAQLIALEQETQTREDLERTGISPRQ